MWGLTFALPPYMVLILHIKSEIPYMAEVSKPSPYMGLRVLLKNIIPISVQLILYHPHI